MHSCDICQGNEGEVFSILRFTYPDGASVLKVDVCENCQAEVSKVQSQAAVNFIKEKVKSCGKPS